MRDVGYILIIRDAFGVLSCEMLDIFKIIRDAFGVLLCQMDDHQVTNYDDVSIHL